MYRPRGYTHQRHCAALINAVETYQTQLRASSALQDPAMLDYKRHGPFFHLPRLNHTIVYPDQRFNVSNHQRLSSLPLPRQQRTIHPSSRSLADVHMLLAFVSECHRRPLRCLYDSSPFSEEATQRSMRKRAGLHTGQSERSCLGLYLKSDQSLEEASWTTRQSESLRLGCSTS